MTGINIYKDIAARTGGDIYIGVVGPVRTGKSTFIKKFMETLVIPNIKDEYKRERAQDELPQSSAGRMIMTTEPKFIPNQAAEVVLDGNTRFNVRMIDCVGYIVDSALGYIENEQPRQVMTPWDENAMDFCTAAELGTKKVICEHSTIGLVVTTDGSIGDIPRKDYEQAEKRIIDELKAINKPFVLLVNSMFPESESARELAGTLAKKYGVQMVVRSSLNESEGTTVKEVVKMEKMLVTGVASDKNTARISVLGVEDKPGIAFKLFQMPLVKLSISPGILTRSGSTVNVGIGLPSQLYV